ncbi:MAG: hypothetical protein ACK5PS_11855 [Desulfopila sp.]
MIVGCPQCGKDLKLSDKFKKNLKRLEPGQKVRIKCIHCDAPFAINGVGEPWQISSPSPEKSEPAARKECGVQVKPPGPPDITWLQEGVFAEQEVVEDIPMALVLVPEGCGAAEVVKAVQDIGYRVETAATARAALEKMAFTNYFGVILHSDFEQGGVKDSAFHRFMCAMAMSKRRYIFYILIGKDLHTLYDLEALANSVNIVVNERDVGHFGTILRKVIPEYETLFGPLMEEMRVQGR